MQGKKLAAGCLMVLAWLWSSGPLTAQAFTFRHYAVPDGLCNNQVQSLLQDSRGFLWIGTAEGLSRFDGGGFRNYYAGTQTGSYFPSNAIQQLVEYKPGHLLLNFGSRLGCAELAQNRFYPPPEPFRTMTAWDVLHVPGRGMLIAGTDSLFMTDTEFRILISWKLPFRDAGRLACTMLAMTADTLLISNLREHFFLQLSTGKLTRFTPAVTLEPEKSLIAWHAYDPGTHTLYGSNFWKGLWQFAADGSVRHHYHSGMPGGGLHTNHIGSVLVLSDSTVYVGTMSGLNVINTREKKILPSPPASASSGALTEKAVLRLLRDRSGTVWLGTNDGVFKKVPALGKRLMDGDNPTTPLPSDWSVVTRGPDGELYAGSLYNGIWKLGSGQQPPVPLRQLPLQMAWVLQPENGYLLAGGSGPSLWRFSPDKGSAEIIQKLKPFYGRSDILTLYYRDRHGDEWYSLNQGGGLIRQPAGTNDLQQYHRDQHPAPFRLGYVAQAAEADGSSVWFAVNKSNSLLQWNRERQQFREWSLEELTGSTGERFGGIQALLGGTDSVLWISSEGAGLIAYHTGRRQTRIYTLQSGLPTAYILGMTRDHRGRIWMATARGLVCFLEKEQRFITFRREQGLPDENFGSGLCWFDSTSRLLLAGSGNKILQVDPDRLIRASRDSVSLYLDDFRINGADFDIRVNSSVPHSFNNLQLGYTGVDLQNGTDLEYAYRLVGADAGWVFAGDKKTAFYHQLPPGHYRFEVRVRHKGETGWLPGLELFQLHIRKAWWQTWGFRLGLLLLMLFAAWWLIRQYLRRKLSLQRQRLEQELAVEQERNRLARELHDGLGSQLSGVKHSFSALRNRMTLPDESVAVFDSTLEKLNDSINELRNVSHSMLSSGFLEEGLETALRNYCTALSGKGPLSVRVQSLIREPLALGAEKSFHLFRIVQELLQNIQKHAQATEALVQLSCHDQRLHITVEDNGIGFESEPAEAHRGMGWRNVETRLKLIGGRADLRTAPGQGTSVDLEVPVSD